MDSNFVANILFYIAILLTYAVLFILHRRTNRIEKELCEDVEQIKNTTCRALFDNDKLQKRIDKLQEEVDWLRNARLVATWKEKDE